MDNTKSPAVFYRSIASAPSYLEGDPTTLLCYDYIPQISPGDLDNGYITRYFARQTNHTNGEIIEINETHYLNLLNAPLYTTAKIIWRIRGRIDNVGGQETSNQPARLYTGVVTANQMAIQHGERQLAGLKLKLSNPLQWYQGE